MLSLAVCGAPAAAPAGRAGEKADRPRKTDKASYRVQASQAVLAYLQAPGKDTLAAALETSLSVRERLPEDAFAAFLAAFCRHEGGDDAGEAALLAPFTPVQRNMYRFFFHEKRAELADALHIIPAYLCKHLRELPNAEDAFRKKPLCPSFGLPLTKETKKSGGRTAARFLCPKCDGMIAARKPPPGASEEQMTPILFHVAYKFLDSRWRFTSPEYSGLKGFISLLGLREGQTVADIGCGNGQFTFPFAEKVGEKGRVYAEEIDPRQLELIGYCVEKGALKNIVPVQGEPDDVKLPEGALDSAFLIHVYRSILTGFTYGGEKEGVKLDPFFDRFFAGIGRALKPDGTLVLVDRIDPRFGVTAAEVTAALKKRGFRLEADKSALKDRTLVLFFKRTPPPAELVE